MACAREKPARGKKKGPLSLRRHLFPFKSAYWLVRWLCGCGLSISFLGGFFVRACPEAPSCKSTNIEKERIEKFGKKSEGERTMGASPSVSCESGRYVVHIWVALHDAATAATTTTKPRHRLRATPRAVGLAGMPAEVLSLVFGHMAPLDAAVAMARCARTCRSLAAFSRHELSRTLARSLFAAATPSPRAQCLLGLHGELGDPPVDADARLVHVLLPVLYGVCAVPVTLVSPRAKGFAGAEELAAAIRSWYLARVTRSDLAFARDAAHGVYRRCGRAALLRDALIPMSRRGVGPVRIRTGDVRPLDTMDHMPAVFASAERTRRRWMMLATNVVLCDDVVAVCMCARISAWPCKGGVPVPPPCRSSGARCPTASVVVAAYAANRVDDCDDHGSDSSSDSDFY